VYPLHILRGLFYQLAMIPRGLGRNYCEVDQYTCADKEIS